jgi:division/cell wall cluster transcriptional repressor MraZ
MSMFLGTHTPRLDDKGRLILPAKFRDELAGGVVITKGQERCLYVFPGAEFARIAEQLRATPMTHKAARAYSRVFFASAHDEVPDRQGRVTIPQHLREYAALVHYRTCTPPKNVRKRPETTREAGRESRFSSTAHREQQRSAQRRAANPPR